MDDFLFLAASMKKVLKQPESSCNSLKIAGQYYHLLGKNLEIELLWKVDHALGAN